MPFRAKKLKAWLLSIKDAKKDGGQFSYEPLRKSGYISGNTLESIIVLRNVSQGVESSEIMSSQIVGAILQPVHSSCVIDIHRKEKSKVLKCPCGVFHRRLRWGAYFEQWKHGKSI